MKKYIAFLAIVTYIFYNVFSIAFAVNTDEKSSPWTREKALHLAEIALFNSSKDIVDALYAAGSASAAVDMIFPNTVGPDRSQFESAISTYTNSGFNWGDANHVTRLYQIIYAADPYEAKRKLFSVFEDIFSVNRDTERDIVYKDINDLHTSIYENMFGNYQVLIKKVLYTHENSGDYAVGRFLDLFNQKDAKNPNENYARELLQLFLMGEYRPLESKDNNDIRNYEESDVRSLAKILTGLNADPMSHAVTLDPEDHYSGSTLAFLTGTIIQSFPYYNDLSGTIDPVSILAPVNGNNGLTDNIIEYIFAQRRDAIALFLADRIGRFYIHDTLTRSQYDQIAEIIKDNNFEIFPSLKKILTLDMVYSEKSMNSVRYKNPLELTLGTIRFLHKNNGSSIVSDPNILDTNLLRRLGWSPYFPGSIFGRDGFDNSLKWSSTSTQSAWMSSSNYFTYRLNGSGAIDFLGLLGDQKMEITSGVIPIMTHANNSYTGSMTILSGIIELGEAKMTTARFSLSSFAYEPSIEEQILANGYPLDPVESIYGGENLSLFESQLYAPTYMESSETHPDEVPKELIQKEVIPVENPVTQIINNDETINEEVLTGVNMEVLTGFTQPILSLTSQASGELSTDTNAASGSIIEDSQDLMTGTLTMDSASGAITTIESTGIIDATIAPEGESSGSNIRVSDTTQAIESIAAASEPGFRVATAEILMATGEVQSESIVSTGTATTSIVPITSGSVSLPVFQLSTDAGIVKIASGSYDATTHILTIYSGNLSKSGGDTPILSGSIVFSPESRIIADTVTPETIVDVYESYIYGEKRLPIDVREQLIDFVRYDRDGFSVPVAPTNVAYFNTYIRGLLSILLSQPEYVLLHGYDIPTIVDDAEQRFLDGITGKLFFVELYGGNDYLSSIIPKDEYSTYLDYRTSQSGGIAITGTGLVDIGDFYMNADLAYGSGGIGFKSLYDQGYLKIFNRVGGYRHPNDHDAAAKQISSYDSTTALSAEGVFGHMVKREFESSHTISLGSKAPNVYRAGHYINLGGNVILSNPMNNSIQNHMQVMMDINLSRSFPANTRNLFKDVGRISEIGKLSVSQGGAPGASGDMNSVFGFAKVLMNNNIGRSFYMGGYGGYDTHGDQFAGLNKNLKFVSSAVTKFFNDVKDTEDVTVVIFSEFGRTNKMNGDLGTDHGDGGGMFVLTSNTKLRSMLDGGSYGNMSIKNAKANALGVGVDYRSVYGKIYEGIYNIIGSEYFATGVDLSRDISMEPNNISLLNYSYQASGANPILNVELTASGSNFNPGKAGYTRLLSGTGTVNQKINQLKEKTTTNGYRYTFQINPISQPYFTVESFSNQYALTTFSGTLTGATYPIVLPNSTREISKLKTSILQMFANTVAPMMLAGSGIILENTGGNILSIANNNQIRIHFQTGVTNVTEITSESGTIIWKGGFILGEKIDKNLFIPSSAYISADNKALLKQNVSHLFKIGADVRGIGMKLNQSVGIEFLGLKDGDTYRVVSSQDGIVWNDVDAAIKYHTVNSGGSLHVSTTHFSFFALVSDSVMEVPPTCSIAISPNNIANGSGTMLGWSLVNTQTGRLDPGNRVLATSGSLSIVPADNSQTLYTITVTNSAGTNTCTASVTTSSGSVNVGSGNNGNSTGSTNIGGNNNSTNPTSPSTPVPQLAIGPGGYSGPGVSQRAPVVCPSSDVYHDCLSSQQSQVSPVTTHTDTIVHTDRVDRILMQFVSDIRASETMDSPGYREQYIQKTILDLRREMYKHLDKKSLKQEIQAKLYTIAATSGNRNIQDATKEIIDSIETYTLAASLGNQSVDGSSQIDAHNDASSLPPIIDNRRYISAERALTLRQDASIYATPLAYISRNTEVIRLSEIGEWTEILYDNIQGYVKSHFLRDENPTDLIRRGGPADVIRRGIIQVKYSAFIRNAPYLNARIRAIGYKNQSVILLDSLSGWYEVLLEQGIRGYIRKELIKVSE